MAVIGPLIGQAAIGFLFGSILASISKPDQKLLDSSSKPAPLSERGSPVPVLIGRHRVAPIFAWEGRRRTEEEPLAGGGGGKGVGAAGGGQRNIVHYADGMHILSVGPGKRLAGIRINGEKVWPFSGSAEPNVDQVLGIESHSSRSGSTFEVAPTENNQSRGTFTIYWGEPDQPQEGRLVSAEALGTSSNHGFIAYVYWADMRLGGPGVWPTVEYDWEVGPYNSAQIYNNGNPPQYTALTPELAGGSAAWLENGLAIDESRCWDILEYNEAGQTLTVCAPGGATLPIEGFPIEIRDNSPASDGRYQVTTFNNNLGVNFRYPDPATLETIPDNSTSSEYGLPAPGLPLQLASGLNAATTEIFAGTWEDLGGTPGDPSGRFTQPEVIVEQVGLNFLNVNQTNGVRGILRHDATNSAIVRWNAIKDPAHVSPRYTTDYTVFSMCVRAPVSNLPADGVNFEMQLREIQNDALQNQLSDTVLMRQDFVLSGGTVQVGTSPVGTKTVEVTPLGDRWFELTVTMDAVNSGANGTGNRRIVPQVRTFVSAGFQGSELEIAYGSRNGFEPAIQQQEEAICPDTLTLSLSPGPATVQAFTGEACPLEVSELGPQGANAAHIVHQLCFASAPHGAGLDENCYGSTLQDIGNSLETERLRSHVGRTGDQKIEGLLETIFGEVGIQRYWDAVNGIYDFKLIRAEPAIATFPEDHIAPDAPESARKFGRSTLTDMRFVYADWALNYRENDVFIPLDGEASTSIERVGIETVRDEPAAEIVADRMAQLEQGRPASLRVIGLRDSQLVRVGDVLSFGNLLSPGLLYRVLEVSPDPMRAATMLSIASEQYSAEALASTAIGGGATGGILPQSTDVLITPDEKLFVWEASSFLGRKIQFAALRIPSQDAATTATIISSPDDVSYLPDGASALSPSGLLVTDFTSQEQQVAEEGVNSFLNEFFLEEGPVFRASADSVQGNVLTLTDQDWGAGRQWLLINNEVMYVQEFEPLGDDLWRARNVLRARLDTRRATHRAGDCVFVLPNSGPSLFQVPHAGRGLELFIKSLPRIGAQQVAAATVPSTLVQTEGRGIIPIRLAHLREENFLGCWRPRSTTFKWDFSLPEGLDQRTGLGMQALGEVTATSAASWPGTFTATLTEAGTGTIFYGPVTTSSPEITVPAADFAGITGDVVLTVIAQDEFGENGVREQQTFPQA